MTQTIATLPIAYGIAYSIQRGFGTDDRRASVISSSAAETNSS